MAMFTCYGQDLHFSQFYNAPLSTNPANTGFIPDADYRFGLLYRNQWSSIMAMPYKTMSAFADAQLMSCLLYTSPSPRDRTRSRMPSSA